MDLPEIRTTWVKEHGVWLKKTATTLVPFSEQAADMLMSVREGKLVVGDLRTARNPRALKLYWALAGIVADALDTTDKKIDGTLRAQLLPEDRWTDQFGKEHIDRPSIALTAMFEHEFRPFLKLAIAMMSMMMGCAPSELRGRFDEIVDGDARKLRESGYWHD